MLNMRFSGFGEWFLVQRSVCHRHKRACCVHHIMLSVGGGGGGDLQVGVGRVTCITRMMRTF